MSDILSQKQETELDTTLGKVKVKVPSLPKRLEIERRRAMYSGGLFVLSNTGADLAEYFAFLDVVALSIEGLKRKESDPSSYDYDSLTEFDFEKLEDVYVKVSEWLNSFRKGMANEQKTMG